MNLLPMHHTKTLHDKIYNMDALNFLKALPSDYAQCCVTSPPYYGLRDYGVGGQLGLEPTLQEYIDKLVMIFEELRRVLKPDGVFWLNLGDSFSSHKDCKGVAQTLAIGGKNEEAHIIPKGLSVTRNTRSLKTQGFKNKDLMLVPHRVAIALQDAGWWVRMDNVWNKPNPMPESVTDRPTKAHEYIFLLSKSAQYYYDRDAIATPIKENTDERYKRGRSDNHKNLEYKGQSLHTMHQARANGDEYNYPSLANKRSVWNISTKGYKGAHFATFPPELPEICIKAGSKRGDVVIDPFMGAGTVGLVAKCLNRHYIGCEVNPEYIAMAEKRIATDWEANQLPLF